MTSVGKKHSVIFVCYGNICRSTMAEAIFKDMVAKKGLANDWHVDSAGTGDHESGSPLYGKAQKCLNKHSIRSSHIARQVTNEDFQNFEYMLGFDKFNMREIDSMKPKNSKSIIRLLNYYNPNERNKEIPDPWGDGDAVFDKVYTSCHDACEGFLKDVYGDS